MEGWGEGKGRFWSTLCLAPVQRSVREGKDPLRTSREPTRVGGTSRGVLAFGKGQCTPRYLHPNSKAKRVFLELEELILGETKGRRLGEGTGLLSPPILLLFSSCFRMPSSSLPLWGAAARPALPPPAPDLGGPGWSGAVPAHLAPVR